MNQQTNIKPIIPLKGEIERLWAKYIKHVIVNQYSKQPKDNA